MQKFVCDDILENINFDKEVIDLSRLNLIETTKAIIMISTYGSCKNSEKKLRCKVSIPNFENLIKELPLTKVVEFVN